MHRYYTEVVFIYVYTLTHTRTVMPHTVYGSTNPTRFSYFFVTNRLCFSSHFSQISRQIAGSPVSDHSRLCYELKITSFTVVVASHLTNQVAATGTLTF